MTEETRSQGEGESRVVRPTRRVSALLGFLLKAEVDAIFQQQPFETEKGENPLELWREFDQRRQRLQPLTGSAAVTPLPDELRPTVQQIKERETYKEHYEAIADYAFVLSPIEALLAPQWYADLDYVDEIMARLSPEMSLEDQVLFAMSEGKITEPIVTGSQVLFTSPRRDLFADPIPTVRETESGEFEILIRAASRPNYVQVAQIGGRLLLTNGVHKVCALYKLGMREVPCVYRTAHSLEEAGFNPRNTSLFRDPIFRGERSALVIDFLNPDTAVPLRMRSMYQVLQVSISVGQLQIPALPKGDQQ